MVENMNFREFAETVTHEWCKDTDTSRGTTTTAGIAGEDTGEHTGLKVMTRDVNSGHWKLKRRVKRRHIRFSTVLYTAEACDYEPVEANKTMPQTSFFSLPV